MLATQTFEFPRTLSALSTLFDRLERAFEQREVDKGSAFWVRLAVDEVFTNMIRHNRSKGDRISLDLDITDRRIAVRLTDYDVPPFDPATIPPVDPSLPAAQRKPGGLGVFFVREKMDELSYAHEDGNLSVFFAKTREPPDD